MSDQDLDRAISEMDKPELIEYGQTLGADVDDEMYKDDIYDEVKELRDELREEDSKEEEDPEKFLEELDEEGPVMAEEKLFWGPVNKAINDVRDIQLNGRTQKRVHLNTGEVKIVSPKRFDKLAHKL